jgi:CBS domain-containing protein
MRTRTATALPTTLLEIRNLHVVSGDGQTADLRSVRCPAQGRAIGLDQCLACADSGGVAREQGARSGYVACRHANAATAALPPGADVDRTPVSAVMATQVLAVRPDVSLEVLAGLFLERGVGGAPVVDADGHPVGVVSRTDLLDERFVAGDTREALARGWQSTQGRYRVELGPGIHPEALPYDSVADAMTRGALTLPETAPLGQAAALMAVRGVHRVLVVSGDGRVVGIVTGSDIARWVAQRGGFLRAEA